MKFKVGDEVITIKGIDNCNIGLTGKIIKIVQNKYIESIQTYIIENYPYEFYKTELVLLTKLEKTLK